MLNHGHGEGKQGDPPEIGGRAFAFAVRVVKLCRILDSNPGVSRTLANQLLRSGTSIGANIEEGKGSQSKADFISKYSIALKEARETNYWLRLLKAADVKTDREIDLLIDESDQIVRVMTAIVRKSKANK